MPNPLTQIHADMAWDYLVQKQLILQESTRSGGAAHPLYAQRMAQWRRLRDLQHKHGALAKLEKTQGESL